MTPEPLIHPSDTLVIEGDCRPEPWPWQGKTWPTCERGTRACYAVHTVRREGTACRKCGTEGGAYTCPESDRVSFACSNYAGNMP